MAQNRLRFLANAVLGGRALVGHDLSKAGEGDIAPKRFFRTLVQNLSADATNDNIVTITPQYSFDNVTWTNCAIGAVVIDQRATASIDFYIPAGAEHWRMLGAAAVSNAEVQITFLDDPAIDSDMVLPT